MTHQIDYGFMASIYGDDPANEHVIPTEAAPDEPTRPEMPEEIIVDGEQEVATIIEYKGQQWLVAASENYTAQDQQEDEEGGMGSLSIGGHSWLVKVRPGNKALPVVAELVKSGKATLTSSQTVLFPDEQYASLLTDLAYSDELGLYDRSKINA